MFEFRTQGYNGYGTQYSPFIDSRLAVAASANFGLVGNGRLYILELTPTGIVAEKWSLSPSVHHSSSSPRPSTLPLVPTIPLPSSPLTLFSGSKWAIG